MTPDGVFYIGFRPPHGGAVVVKHVDDEPAIVLPHRRDLAKHSDGVDWGNHEPGSRQLALALLADVHGDEVALALHPKFAMAAIARLPWQGWRINSEAVEEWVSEYDRTGRVPYGAINEPGQEFEPPDLGNVELPPPPDDEEELPW